MHWPITRNIVHIVLVIIKFLSLSLIQLWHNNTYTFATVKLLRANMSVLFTPAGFTPDWTYWELDLGQDRHIPERTDCPDFLFNFFFNFFLIFFRFSLHISMKSPPQGQLQDCTCNVFDCVIILTYLFFSHSWRNNIALELN